MLDNVSFNLIADYWLNRVGANTGKWCPNCYSKNTKMFGYSTVGSQRKRCNICGKTYTGLNFSQKALDRIELLRTWILSSPETKPENQLQLSSVQTNRIFASLESVCLNEMHSIQKVKDVATTCFRVPFKGRENYIWLIISTDMASGKILHITPTFVPFCLPNQGQYKWTQLELNNNARDDGNRALEKAELTEKQFLSRPQFDRINYGRTVLGSKKYDAALPVLVAHCHFLVLARLGHGRNIHSLEHEIFFRGACITQNSSYIKSEGTSLFYVVGECSPNAKLSGKRKLGWWMNQWFEYQDKGGQTLAISKICGENQLPICMINHDSIKSFKKRLTQRFDQFKAMVPQRVLSAIYVHAVEHNSTLVPTSSYSDIVESTN